MHTIQLNLKLSNFMTHVLMFCVFFLWKELFQRTRRTLYISWPSGVPNRAHLVLMFTQTASDIFNTDKGATKNVIYIFIFRLVRKNRYRPDPFFCRMEASRSTRGRPVHHYHCCYFLLQLVINPTRPTVCHHIAQPITPFFGSVVDWRNNNERS